MVMTEEEFNNFEHESAEYLGTQQDILRDQYDMGSYDGTMTKRLASLYFQIMEFLSC
jgi:hypothetical protein